jgi:DNA-binding response OmpR family regulator
MTAKPKVLVIEDNEDTRTFLQKVLIADFHPFFADNAVRGIEIARTEIPEVIVLDIMLPHLSGTDACQILKKDERTEHIPIIFLSAKGAISDITSGLNLGADDYLSKPFDYKELIARIWARIRNAEAAGKNMDVVVAGDLRIEPSTRQVVFKGKTIDLTLTEFDILRLLAGRAGDTVSRAEIIETIRQNSKKAVSQRTIDVHIRAIRKKIPEMTRLLTSIYGAGYRYEK